MDPQEITGPDKALREKMARIEEKQERGEKLTQEEKGVKGAMANIERGAAEEKRAAREGRLEEYREEHRTRSWMAGEDTRPPRPSPSTEREVERIREKQARGETLTREEAGKLGGAAQAGSDEARAD